MDFLLQLKQTQLVCTKRDPRMTCLSCTGASQACLNHLSPFHFAFNELHASDSFLYFCHAQVKEAFVNGT